MTDFTHIRGDLVARLEILEGRVARIEGDLRKPGSRDWTERASEIVNDEVLESLDSAETSEIAAIRNAITRIDAGRYGKCSRCDEPIAENRLRAVPEADLCIGCAG